jgi:hypothetical protein
MPGTQIKNFCSIDVDAYIQSLREEFTKLDMNWDPEVDPNLEEGEREKKAKSWLESRIRQLDAAQKAVLTDLEKIEFLEFRKVSNINYRVSQLYIGLATEAQNLYQKAKKGEKIERPVRHYQDPANTPEHQVPTGRNGPLIK